MKVKDMEVYIFDRKAVTIVDVVDPETKKVVKSFVRIEKEKEKE